mmetsp:Transcript_1146/g.1977  ORF Transcript_1146/g.1977 Transcript_1146/m.1977 type:complete len:216 (-) Transcript_1146:850-1497(-)
MQGHKAPSHRAVIDAADAEPHWERRPCLQRGIRVSNDLRVYGGLKCHDISVLSEGCRHSKGLGGHDDVLQPEAIKQRARCPLDRTMLRLHQKVPTDSGLCRIRTVGHLEHQLLPGSNGGRLFHVEPHIGVARTTVFGGVVQDVLQDDGAQRPVQQHGVVVEGRHAHIAALHQLPHKPAEVDRFGLGHVLGCGDADDHQPLLAPTHTRLQPSHGLG